MSTRPCPNCGTLNDVAAGFCSNCSNVLSTPGGSGPETPAPGGEPTPADSAAGYASGRPAEVEPPTQPPQPPAGSMPFAPPPPSGAQQWTPPAGTSSNRRRFLPVGIGIVVIVAIRILMSGALFSNSGPDSVTLAPSVNGLPQITSGQPATTAQQMKTSMESSNVTGGDAAAYGTGPDATFYALVGPGTPDAQQNYDDAKSGLAGSATFGPQTSQDVGGLTLLCSDLTYSSGTTGALCVWDQDFQGIVISKGPGMTQTAQFGAAVHDSIQ